MGLKIKVHIRSVVFGGLSDPLTKIRLACVRTTLSHIFGVPAGELTDVRQIIGGSDFRDGAHRLA